VASLHDSRLLERGGERLPLHIDLWSTSAHHLFVRANVTFLMVLVNASGREAIQTFPHTQVGKKSIEFIPIKSLVARV
jgi:hypothetical protein